MKLRIIEGGAGSGKSRLCVSEIAERQRREPFGAPLILLVPEQATFVAEQALVGELGASLRAQALSFSGLYRVLAEQEGKESPLPWLDEQGRAMLLAACLQEQRPRLEVLQNAAGNISFVDALARSLVEFEQFCVGPEELRRAAEKTGGNGLLAAKLRDLALLYESYLAKIAGGFRDQGVMMQELAALVEGSSWLAGAELWLDGFLDMNPSQLAVIRGLFGKAAAVNLCICLPVGREDAYAEQVFGGQIRLREQFMRLGRELAAEVEITRLTANFRHQDSPALAAVEGTFAHGCFGWGRNDAASRGSVELFAAADPEAEAVYAAEVICRLCREEGWQFRDMAVITRNLDAYRPALENAFRDFNLPCFFDMGAELGQHPLIKLVLCALAALGENWAGPAVLAYLKSGLAPVESWEADILENYALRFGLKSYMWQRAGSWRRGEPEELAVINEIGRRGLAPLLALKQRVPQEGARVADYVGALRELLAELKVEEKLLAWEQQATRDEELRLADAHRQILPKLLGLLDQLESFLGEAAATALSFGELLREGTVRLRLSSIPPGENEVNIAEVSRSRLPELKAAVVLGLNEGGLPALLAEEGLLDSAERETLQKLGLELAPGSRERQQGEDYLTYIALTRSSRRLYLSFAKRGGDGAELAVSAVIPRLWQLFPDLAVLEAEPCPEDQLGGDRRLLAGLSAHLNDLLNESTDDVRDAFWREVCRQLLDAGRLAPQIKALRQGLDYLVEREPLDQRRLRGLYRQTDFTSVSRLERFNSCPCQYYASYGLALAPRPEFKLQVMDLGSLYHYILAEVMQELAAAGCDWAALDLAQVEPLVRRALADFAALDGNKLGDILQDSGRNAYIAEKAVAIVSQSMLDLARNLAAGSFRPARFELGFGLRDGLQSISIEGQRVRLRGAIDRVDVARGENGSDFVRIIDYKLRAKELSLSDIYYGLNWQLPLYMEALLTNARQEGLRLRPAGMFYVPVQELIKSVKTDEEAGAAFKLRGMAILDREALVLAERDFSPGHHARTMQVQWKKDDSFGARTQGLTPEEYGFLQRGLKKLVRRSVERVQAGEIRQRPLEISGRRLCDYCDFYPVCALDLAVDCDKLAVEKLSRGEALRRLKEL